MAFYHASFFLRKEMTDSSRVRLSVPFKRRLEEWATRETLPRRRKRWRRRARRQTPAPAPAKTEAKPGKK